MTDRARDTLTAVILLNEARNIAVFNGASAMEYVFLSNALARLQNDLRRLTPKTETE